MDLTLNSSAFHGGGAIPAQYTCDGQNISPPLSWRGVPTEAQSLALILDDPDAPNGLFTHWVVHNLPPDLDSLSENADSEIERVGAVQGRNDFGPTGYGGPCPPRGADAHRYYFRLYALDTMLDLLPGATRAQLLDVMGDHILARSELIGTYGREGGS